MTLPTRAPATFEDLDALPDNVVGQIVDGELYVTPRPATPHAAAVSAIGEELGPPFKRGKGGPGGWMILFEPELHFGRDALVPDLAGWRRERMATLPEVPAIELAPDWVCEVLSPSTEALDRVRKMRIWARERVAHVWLVSPAAKVLEVYALETDHYGLVGTFEAEERVRAVPFDAVELELAALWMR